MYRIKIFDGPEDTKGTVIHSSFINAKKVKWSAHPVLDGVSDMEFTIDPSNPGWNKIRPLHTLIELKNVRTGKVFFQGRVLQPEQTMSSEGMFSIKYVCESKKAYLNDSHQRWHNYQSVSLKSFYSSILNNYNKGVEPHKRFKVGNVTVTDPNDNLYRILGYESTFATLQDKLVSRLGGHLVVREESDGTYLDYLKDVGKISKTKIKLKTNLKDLRKEIDPTEIATRIVVLGAKLEIRKAVIDWVEGETARVEIQENQGEETTFVDIPMSILPDSVTTGSIMTVYGENPYWTFEKGFDETESSEVSEPRLTMASVNGGKDYVDNPALIAEFGIIEGVITLDDVNVPSTLKLRAEQFFASQAAAKVTYDITPLDLSTIDVKFDSFNVGDWYYVVNEVLGINELLQIIEMTIDGDNPHLSKITMGQKRRTLSQYQAEANKKMQTYDQLQNRVESLSASNIEVKKQLKVANDELKAMQTSLSKVDIDNLPEELQGISTQIDNLQQTINDLVIPEYGLATTTSNGLMSSADKTKLDGLKNYEVATETVAGLMSSDDKKKVNSVGNKTLLTTTNKDDLVSAINEINARLSALEP